MRARGAAATPDPDDELPDLLRRMSEGDSAAMELAFTLVYDELRERARAAMRHQQRHHTLQATSLVHEVFLRVAKGRVRATNKAHLMNLLAQAMRQVLVDHARKKKSRGGSKTHSSVELEELTAEFEKSSHGILELDAALERLRRLDPIAAQVVTLRYFGGLSLPEVARMLRIPLRTVERVWAFARAWLRRELD